MSMTQIGPYRIIKRLGFGGMCEVYLAERYGASGFQKQVAIKVLLPEHRGKSTHERHLIREANTGAKLHHPAIAQVYDLGIDQGQYYIVMEHIDGSDLRTLMPTTGAPPHIVLHMIAQLTRALDYLHTFRDESDRWLGLVHRDISPSNVLVTPQGDLKLIDFGITKATQNMDRTHGKIRKGKYAYMSPEYINGHPLEASSDLFSLGIVFMELLCGQRPFDAPDIMSTMARIKDPLLAAPLDHIDPRLQDILQTCLHKDPRHRHQSARALHDDIIQLVQSGMTIASTFEVADWIEAQRKTTSATLEEKSEKTHTVV